MTNETAKSALINSWRLPDLSPFQDTIIIARDQNCNPFFHHLGANEDLKIKSHCYELYSLELVTEIRSVASALQSKKVYTLTGDSKPQHNLIVFQLDEALALEKSVKRKEKLA